MSVAPEIARLLGEGRAEQLYAADPWLTRFLAAILRAGKVTYRWGGNRPPTGDGVPAEFDCSQWAQWAMGEVAGIKVGDTTAKGLEAWAAGRQPTTEGRLFLAFHGSLGSAYHVGFGLHGAGGSWVSEVSGGGRNSYPGGSDYHPERQALRVDPLGKRRYSPQFARPVLL